MRPRILKAGRHPSEFAYEPVVVKMIIEIPPELEVFARDEFVEAYEVDNVALSIGHSILEQLRNMK